MDELQFPNMVNNYIMYCNYRNNAKKDNVLDLRNINWIYPTTLLPLGVFIKTNRSIGFQAPYNENISRYIYLVTENKTIDNLKNKTYLPIINLPSDELKSEKIIKYIFNLHNNYNDYGGEQVFKYLINELVDNIYQHSDFKNALVMAQRYETKKFTEICFFDDGITIKGSFLKKGINFNDAEAITQALKGVSSKNKERGYGLSSNLNLFINGLGGEVLIISGIGAIYWSKTAQKIYKLPDIYKLKGTLISIRIPYPVKMVDIYDYID